MNQSETAMRWKRAPEFMSERTSDEVTRFLAVGVTASSEQDATQVVVNPLKNPVLRALWDEKGLASCQD